MREIPYDWARVACPTCKVPPQFRCRTAKTNRVTDAHAARINAARGLFLL